KGNWPAALEQYEQTYHLNAKYGLGDIFREVGKGYLHTGRLEKAVEFLHFFLDNRSSDPEGRYWVAVAFQKLGQTADMRNQLRTLYYTAVTNAEPSLFYTFRDSGREYAIFRSFGLSL